MAQHKSAEKRIRRNARRQTVNIARKGRVRTAVRKVEAAIASGDADAARVALRSAQPELQRGARKGVTSKRTVARKVSRLARRIKTLKK
jgi:small subunit ribosomal protein S20